MFEMALRAFDTGGLSFSDLRLTLKQQLADGAPPDELLKTLHRRELIEPLPDYAHADILAILQSQREGGAADGAAPNEDPSAAQHALAGQELAADPDFDESTMSRLMQTLKSEWAAEPPDASVLTAEIKTMRSALDKRDEELESLRNDHTRVLGLLETRARSVQQLETDLREHAAEIKAAKEALQLQQNMNRELSEALAEKLAASEAARARDAEVAARSEEALRSAERHRAEMTAVQEAAAASDAALHEARRTLEERESALQQARRSLDERESALEKVRYSLSEHEAALDQARQLVSDRDAQISSLQQQRAEIGRPLQSSAQSERLRAELAAALEHTAALDHTVAMDRNTAHERTAALEADLMAAHAALGAEQKKARRLDSVVTESNSLLAERDALLAERNALASERDALLNARNADAGETNVLNGKVSALQRSLDERTAELAAQKQEHAKVLPGFASRIRTLESELKEARQRVDSLTAALTASRASVATRTAQETAKLSVEVGEFTPSPVVKRNLDIKEFALSPPIDWLRHRSVQVAGICLLVVAAVIGIRSFSHHPAPVKAAEGSSASLPLPGSIIQDCEACPALTVLPAGRFKQGSADANASAFVKPMHWVAIENPVAMSTNEVTVAQFQAFATATGRNMQGCDVYDGQWKHQQASSWQNPGFEQTARHPVTCVSWDDAKAYAQWLSAQTGHHYRLPSASEWEYAARAGGEAAQPWSASGADVCANANVADSSAAKRFPGWVAFACNDGYVFTSPVATFKASAFGLNDMLGNVFQWTEDCWNPSYARAPIDGSARTDGNCGEHELRGGSWFSFPEFVRADYRNHFAADYRASSIGIRLVRDTTP
jgi:formylglycine-generating enzyme